MLEPRFCFFIKKTKTARDALTLISNAETSNIRKMHVTIVMKIMERIRCGVYVTKSVHVVIRRSLTPKSCFQRVFFLCFSYKFHSFALYSSRFWKYVYNPFCYVRKNKIFYVPNILILSRLTNLRVFTNILYDSKERNIINNPPPVGMTKFLCLPMTGVIGSGLEYYT